MLMRLFAPSACAFLMQHRAELTSFWASESRPKLFNGVSIKVECLDKHFGRFLDEILWTRCAG